MNYIVKSGESIVDCVLNSTGSLDNWESIIDINNFSTWTPDLNVGQVIIIPDDAVIQPNNLSILNIYSSNNNSLAADWLTQVTNFIALII